MPLYEYEAKTYEGKTIRGKMEGNDEAAVTSALRKQNYYPVKIRPFSKIGLNMDIADFQKVKIKDISIFCRQFSVIITSGITILRGLEIVKLQTENKKLARILGEVFEDVQKGKTFSAAMGRHGDFPDMLINMIEVGEASGTLDHIMSRMAVYYDKEYKLQQKIKQALTYPAVISVVAVAVVIFLVAKVIPTFVSMLEGAGELPLPTRIVIGLSDFIRFKWYILVFIIIALTILIRAYIKTDSGRNELDRLKLNMPMFGKIFRKIITSRFARTFGTLIGSGVPLLQSLTICSSVVGNAVVKGALDEAREDIKRGATIGDTLSKSGQFPLMLTHMIKIGEESGSLDDVLTKTSDFYENEVEVATAQLTTMIEPLIIVVLGGVVAFIILSILLPMFQLYDSIG